MNDAAKTSAQIRPCSNAWTEGEKSQRYIDYQSPENTLKKIHDAVSNLTPAQKAEIKKVVSRTTHQ